MSNVKEYIGTTGVLVITDNFVYIKRFSGTAMSGFGDLTIPFSTITAIAFTAPGKLEGNIRIFGIGLDSNDNQSIAGSSNSVHFKEEVLADFIDAKNMIEKYLLEREDKE